MNRRNFMKVTGISIIAGNATLGCATSEAPKSVPPEVKPPKGAFQFGLRSLDENTWLEPGELAVIVGGTASGKTSLMLTGLKAHVNRYGGRMVYYDYGNQGIGKGFERPKDEAVLDRLMLLTNPDRYALTRNQLHWLTRNNGVVFIDTCGECRAPAEYIKMWRGFAEEGQFPVVLALPVNREPCGGGGCRCWDAETGLPPPYSAWRSADLVIHCFRDGVPGKPAVGIQILKNRHGLYGPEHIFTHRVVGPLALDPLFR